MTYVVVSVILSFLALKATCSATNSPLNNFINYYETLNYAGRSKLYRRSANDGQQKTHTLEFDAHGRTFKLKLRPDTTTLSSGVQIVDGIGKKIDFDKASLCVGELVGEPGSIVHGVLSDDGTFTGKIHSKDGVYFVEAAHYYFDKPEDFHSVIYKDEDVTYNIQFSEPKVAPFDDSQKIVEEKMPSNIEREKRAINAYEHNTCLLSMEADYTFLEMAKEPVFAVGEILKHVQALNLIYGATFNTSGTYSPYSIQFQVGFLQVYDKQQTPKGLQPQNIDISTFLNRMTKKDYSKYCEAVYFTHRDFEGGILGLAWIGHPTGRAGGMCDPRRGTTSYNTAVVTFTLYGRKSPPKVSEITFVHEVGHAFGAQHDDESCSPGGVDGNYIMYDKATSGDRKRNDLFSECSVKEIKANVQAKRARVIDKYAKPHPRLCLESVERMLGRESDLCGNGVIEGEEECDCGPKAFCKELEPGNCCNWETCKLRKEPGVNCSASQGPCCNMKTCKPVANQNVCENATDCLREAKCPDVATMLQTKNYKCPAQKPQVDEKPCGGGAFLCHKGFCSLSICVKHNLKPCECKEKKQECNACCMDDKVCRPAHQIELMKRSSPYNYSIGTPCANNTGYCDIFHYCQRIDMDGPLLQLYKLYFTSEGLKELTEKYWWAILLGTLGLIAVVVLLVVFGARYTESSNPELNEKSPHKTCFCCKPKRQDKVDFATELKEGPRDEIL